MVVPSGDAAMCRTRLVCPRNSATLTRDGYFQMTISLYLMAAARDGAGAGEGAWGGDSGRMRADAGAGGRTSSRES